MKKMIKISIKGKENSFQEPLNSDIILLTMKLIDSKNNYIQSI